MGNVKRKQVRAENGKMGSLHAMLSKCPDERSCERRVIEVRWPDGWVCRYSHRGGDATTELLADCCAGYYTRDQLKREVFLPQPVPPKPPKRPRGRPRKHPVLQL